MCVSCRVPFKMVMGSLTGDIDERSETSRDACVSNDCLQSIYLARDRHYDSAKSAVSLKPIDFIHGDLGGHSLSPPSELFINDSMMLQPRCYDSLIDSSSQSV